MSIQIGRFSFRGPFMNLDEIKDRPGIYILHKRDSFQTPLLIRETSLLKSSISEELSKRNLTMGTDEGCFVSVYNTFCVLTLDRQEMVEEIKHWCDLKEF